MAADVRLRRICSAQVEGGVWERQLCVNPRVYLQVKEGRVPLRVCVSAESLRPQSFELFSPQLFFSDLHPPPRPVSLRKKAAAERRQSTGATLVFSVCFSRLSDPCGLSLDTNDSLLSLMPAVLAQGAQEKEPDRWPLASSLIASQAK